MAEIKLKDVIHLYLGCEVKVPGGKIILTSEVLATWDFKHHGLKPILRPLSNITNEEGRLTFGSIEFMLIKNINDIDKFKSHQFLYLLSKHFDLFGLIESGQAINKTNPNK